MPQHDGQDADGRPFVVYCRCAYADVVPVDVKDRVLDGLCESEQSFDGVADLCEMSARRDPELQRLAETKNTKIVACYPRAVRGLFEAAGAPLDEDGVAILNMRTETSDAILRSVIDDSTNGRAESSEDTD
jgi:hypothetical protein